MLRLRKWQLENQDRVTMVVLVGRVVGTPAVTFSWQQGREACRACESSRRKKQGGWLLRGTRLL